MTLKSEIKQGFAQLLGAQMTVNRLRLMQRRVYNFQPRVVKIEGNTSRKCYVHPQNNATHWELNTQDRSYKRPVCEGCANAVATQQLG